jgi:transposase-like protein
LRNVKPARTGRATTLLNPQSPETAAAPFGPIFSSLLGGESPHALAKRHGISRNLIKIWVAKYEAGGLDSDSAAADVLADYEARIAALERLVGKLALENEFLKGASRHVRQPRSASTSVVAGPVVSQSQKDVG